MFKKLSSLYRRIRCIHRKLQVVDTTVDGDFVIFCPTCDTAWIAPCVAEGVGLTISKSAITRGCENCRQLVMSEIKKTPDEFDFHCPDCGEHWSLKREVA